MIINTYDQNVAAGGDRIMFFRQTRGDSRSGQCAGWHVGRIKNGEWIATDPEAHWQDHGQKFFLIWNRADIKLKLAKAIAWANEKYGQREFVKNRMGDYVEKEVNERFPLPKRERRGAG